ncbi:interferon-induced transmembrane protein 1 [Danio rerio]|uniref:IFITM1 n=1 Tax=Danio rerio TaxID=7955 RepID=A5WUL9_DANRE|nr:interferon-induced transmembrane protein 1 [Danio rerio]ADK55689.1 IFITM1 [Danio rerio]CAN88773.1 novel interferon-induced transmembrane protein [Danio rerio]|eukprot:NP_001103757.1 uncharacterized protein LOC100003209 [Danio rerio]
MQSYPLRGNPMQDDKTCNGQPVVVSMPAQKLDDDIIFSTFNFHYCNPCCLGFGAFYNSVKARDRRLLGDYASASTYGTRARRLNIASVILGVLYGILLIVILVYAYQLSRFSHQ